MAENLILHTWNKPLSCVQWHVAHSLFFLSKKNKSISISILFYLEKDLKAKCVVEMEGNQTVLNSAVTNMNKGDPRWAPAFILLSIGFMQNVVTAQVVLILNFVWILFLNLSEVFTWWTQTELLALAGLEIADWADFCRLNMNHGGVDLDSLWTSAVILRFVGVHSLTSIILLLKLDRIFFFFFPFLLLVCLWT